MATVQWLWVSFTFNPFSQFLEPFGVDMVSDLNVGVSLSTWTYLATWLAWGWKASSCEVAGLGWLGWHSHGSQYPRNSFGQTFEFNNSWGPSSKSADSPFMLSALCHYTSWIIRSIVTSVFVPITPACGKTLASLDMAKVPGSKRNLWHTRAATKLSGKDSATNKPSVANILLSFESMANLQTVLWKLPRCKRHSLLDQQLSNQEFEGFVSLTLSCKIGGHHNGNRSSLLGKGKHIYKPRTFRVPC